MKVGEKEGAGAIAALCLCYLVVINVLVQEDNPVSILFDGS